MQWCIIENECFVKGFLVGWDLVGGVRKGQRGVVAVKCLFRGRGKGHWSDLWDCFGKVRGVCEKEI